MRVLRQLTFLLVFAAMQFPIPAQAGGWWSYIDLESPYLAPGQKAEAGTEFLFASIEEAEQARRNGRFYVYLLRGLDFNMVDEVMTRPAPPPGWWRLGDSQATRVGRVVLGGWDGNLARAHARFVVPETLEPAPYALMFCDAGCAHPLGDIVPSKVRVVADPLTARLAQRVARLQTRALERERVLRQERQESAKEAAEDAQAVDRLHDRIGLLKQRLVRERAHLAIGDSGSPWWADAGWFVAGVVAATLIGLLVLGRRPRRPSGPPGESNGTPSAPVEVSVGRPGI
jgi:hypothetical protein